MLGILERIFIPNSQNVEDLKVRERYGFLAGIIGILCNLLLFAGKGLAGVLSGSIAIWADAFNNLTDAGSSVVTLLGFYAASRPADDEHPFGHGRMEYVSGLVVSGVILLVAYELVKNSIDKILHPEEILFSWLTVGILLASVGVKTFMWYYNSRWGKKVSSPAMSATAADSFSDVLATTGVLAGVFIAKFTGLKIDGYLGILIGGFIGYSGIKAVRESLSPLLGETPHPELVHQIHDKVMAHEGILGMHDLVIHDYGPGRRMISLHMEMPNTMALMEMHDLTDEIEFELRKFFSCDVTIHMDPIVVDDERVFTMKEKVLALVDGIDSVLSIHDFRLVDGPSHTNLIFDVVAPHSFRLSDEELHDLVCEKIAGWEDNYYAVVQVEHSLV